MQRRPDFRLYHSNALDVLAGLLAKQVAQLPADGDWLRPDVVLVPQFSMRRWLQQALAEHSGICANLRFLTPGEFVDLALDANLAPATAGDRLAPEVLRWHLLRELQTAPPSRLAGFSADPMRTWTLTGALADTYEKYQAWRRDLLQRWERGADADDWQATLWRRIARNRQHRARRIGEYLQRFGAESAGVPDGLPPRLFVFACQNVSPDVLQLIASQARIGEQHFYLHTPARAFWGDLGRWAADYQPADDDHFLGGIEGESGPNPLLAAWGQAGRDFIATLGSGEAVAASFEAAGFAEPPHGTLLGRLQADVLDNRAPLATNRDGAWPRAQVDRVDSSLQFHACHTRLREVQVLHDQLRALLEMPGTDAQPALQPRDIAVLAPDIDLYAPHIEAVFGGALGTPRELPYTIADASPLASAPLAEAFARLLELPLRPLTVGDAVDLLAVPAIAARFDIDDSDRGALQGWLEEAGARWGLDGADRARHGARDDNAYTFEFALDRLLLGYASGADDDIAGVAPWPDLEGQSATALDALLRFLAMLRDGAARLAGPHPPVTWARELERLLDAAFATERDSADAAVLKRLRECTTGFARNAALADYSAPVEHAVVLEHVREELTRSDARAPFLSGGICFGRMVPMRLIPFQVICLLGLDDGAFPARDGRDPLNRISQKLDTRERRVGDPSRRDADRYLFLQLFASAGRVLYLSWCGMDPRDGSEREPSTLVSELLDAAVEYHAATDVDTRDAVRKALVVRHALQPFSPAAFGAPQMDEDAVEPRRFSFDARWHAAAEEGSGNAAVPVFAPLPLPRDVDTSAILSIERLRSALNKPHVAYLRDGLGLRLPEEEPPLAEHEPFGAPEPLPRHALRSTIFDVWLRAGSRPDARALHAHLLARALLAPGADGRATVEQVLDDVAPFAQCALGAGFGAASQSRSIEQAAGPRILQGMLPGVQRGGVLRVALRPEGRHGGQALRHGLDWLLGSLHELPLYEIASVDEKGDPVLNTHPPLSREGAISSLQALVALRDEALQVPLPFLPRTGFTYFRRLLEKGEESALEKAAEEWRGNDRQRGDAGPATRLALRGRDPFIDNDSAQRDRFARIATALFGAFENHTPVRLEDLA
ncbi:exodeoxyribonuclease V subunit gamma [Lysobacter sp. CFH 32150]|uniref:exodeoxyribonuclease V subunit gamma n=1 Tax=Lysobacter sp. CFH 32150 TaxID=2927128 RepID=UPI001FA6D7C9|nr:exodeoxyribonuclease V subunit gamma [Lysobacter sp. CFH 32150]MCI4568049.1 exodeoxyribonuclease V subunit gamma [Lysobacter sp. CFH 32150]